MRMLGLALCALGLYAAPVEDAPALRGFSTAAARAAREWETKFRAIPDPVNLREYMRRLSARPHHLGSPYDKDNAEWLLAKLRSWGLDARIETFEVLFPTPKERAVEMTAPARFTAKLEEPAVAADATSGQKSEQLPTYNAYSIDGDVTGRLVYVNYGIPEDYRELARLGISVKGAIVIARYGVSWRGIKPKVAAEHGAIGCLIYSDPRDDGYFRGDVYPKGPYRPKDGVQRGSVMDMPLYPGDPLTPGIGATKDARRLALGDVKTFTKIPVLPISYADAQPLLAALEGPVAPVAWRGALPITYKIGPGPATVRLKVRSNWDLHPVYNVVVRIPGAVWPDEWIVRGNHHDAWVNGADDPVSAAAALLEEARGFSELLKQGWRPARTIVYCLWDGEEQGLLGSTEWAEYHAEELRHKAVAYLNTDATGRGVLGMAGSHSLERFLNGVARDIEDPETKMPVWKRVQLTRISSASPAERQQLRQSADLRISAIGSGSDYTAFLHHLGIPSLNLGFAGEDGSGIYHSIYDSFHWYTSFSDTDFVYGRALAQTVGTAVMRLAGAELLPFDFVNFADTVRRYVDELQKLSGDMREDVRESNRQIEEGVFRATANVREPRVPPTAEPVPPHLSFAPLENAVTALALSAERYDKTLAAAMQNEGGAALARAAKVNAVLREAERALTRSEGLPGRPWFKHHVYAPGVYTGYSVKTLPGVREAIEQGRWQDAETEIGRLAEVLGKHAELVQRATGELGGLR
ncbi:MAG TPA: transferrin receptor-like dimerization domain-containing protein [Bryobacteraceae bacterium]|nr:transferrin receptor-like dimerization domain-containing protein [Bryobacteraceae bacterium]